MDNLKTAVLLVDNKRRDLRAATLIAWHLEKLGVRAILEPLEAWQAVLPSYRPDIIVFNHLTTTSLSNYSQRLHQLGVKVAVLPNESLFYDPDTLNFNCRKRNANAHIDLYFCWSEMVKTALVRNGFGGATRLEVVGNPKFDFYYQPWSKLYSETVAPNKGKPRILICTNFALACYKELPRIEADKLFDLWSKQVPLYANYWQAIETNYRARQAFFSFLEVVIKSQKFDVVLRPHPGEQPSFYQAWLQQFPSDIQASVRVAADDPIQSLILNCDLEISCETCTTALESWLCRKPTIELVFEKHPMFYHPEVAKLNVECHQPKDLVPLMEQQLAHPEQSEHLKMRDEHLRKWCASPDGTTSARIAQTLANVAREAHPDFSTGLSFTDHRRAFKMRSLHALGLPYNYAPFLSVKTTLWPEKYGEKSRIYEKTIKPGDVKAVRTEISICAT